LIKDNGVQANNEMPTWDAFAWAAFLYGSIGGDRKYQELMKREEFLHALRNKPETCDVGMIREYLLKGYLNAWKTRVQNSDASAAGIRNSIKTMQPLLSSLEGLSVTTVDFQGQLAGNGGVAITVSEAIEYCYEIMRKTGFHIGPTATAKILHILDPQLFVMWDQPILAHFHEVDRSIKDSPEGYRTFLQRMKNVAVSVRDAFYENRAEPGETPEEYLSHCMGYSPPETMAKYLDEFFWVTVTNRVKVPPSWHPS